MIREIRGRKCEEIVYTCTILFIGLGIAARQTRYLPLLKTPKVV
jgi:hypothetical protein